MDNELELLEELLAKLQHKLQHRFSITSATHDSWTIAIYGDDGNLKKVETSATIEETVNKLKDNGS